MTQRDDVRASAVSTGRGLARSGALGGARSAASDGWAVSNALACAGRAVARCGARRRGARTRNAIRRNTTRPPVSATHCTARFLLSAPDVKPCMVANTNIGMLEQMDGVPELARQPLHHPRRQLDGDEEVGRGDSPCDGARSPRRCERDEHLPAAEVHEVVGPQREQVHADEHDRECPEKLVQVEQPRGDALAPDETGRQREAPQDAERHDRPRDQARGARRRTTTASRSARRTATSVTAWLRCRGRARRRGRSRRGHRPTARAHGPRRRRR